MPMHRIMVGSDIHFDVHHKHLWYNFERAVEKTLPARIVLLGDLADLGMLSKYHQGAKDPLYAVPQIKLMAERINYLLKFTERIDAFIGNHDERWDIAIGAGKGQALKGAKGLSFEEQTYAQGLDPKVRWYREDENHPGLIVGRNAVIFQHGHVPRRMFSGEHLAYNQLRQLATMSSVRGHHHRGQLMCRTELGNTTWALSMPHMSANHAYEGGNPNRQRGFATVDLVGSARERDCTLAFPHLVISDKYGRFTYDGKYYG